MWQQIIYALVMMIISAVLQAATQKQVKPKEPEKGELDTPTADEGGTIGVVFGTVIKKNSNVIWYGDASTTPIKSDAGGKK